MKQVLPLLLLSTLLRFNSIAYAQVSADTYQRGVYHCEAIGWKIKIPKGWSRISQAEVERRNVAGKQKFEETTEVEIDISKLQNVLAIQKGRTNRLTSTVEPYEITYPGEWEANHADLKEVLTFTFRELGFESNVSETTYEKISSINFEVFTVEVLAPGNPAKIIGYQTLYLQYVNGYDFRVIIFTTDADARKEVMKAFRASKFRKKR